MTRTALPFVLAFLPLGAAGCPPSSSRYATHERQIEARTEGELDLHYAWVDAGTLLIVSPLHAANGRGEFSESRLDALSGKPAPAGGGARSWLAVSVWRFAGESPLALGTDGLKVAATTPAGKVESVPPSKLLAQVTDRGARPVVGSLTGAGNLPALAQGQELQLVAALPTAASVSELVDVSVALPGGPVALARVRVPALQWDEFRSQPSRERFEALLKERAGGEQREPGR